LLKDLGIPFRFITTKELEQGVLGRQGFKACILTRASALSPRSLSELENYAQSGGLLIADSQPALYTETLQRQASPALDGLFGVSRADFTNNYDGNAARPQASRSGIPLLVAEQTLRATRATAALTVSGHPILLRRDEDEARTLYLNLILRDYRELRLDAPEKAAWVRSQVRTALIQAGVVSPCMFVHAPDTARIPVQVTYRQTGNVVLIACHLNPRTNGLALTPEVLGLEEPVRGTLELRRSLGGVNLVTGETMEAQRQHPISLRLDQPVLLRLTP
jgi:hypothetical protein